MSMAIGAVLVLGAGIAGFGVPFCYRQFAKRTNRLPEDDWSQVTGPAVTAGFIGASGVVVASGPSLLISVPTGIELMVGLLTTAGLFSIGLIFGVATLRLPLDHFPETLSLGGRGKMRSSGPTATFVLIFLVGIGEQLLFRGLVQPSVAAQLGTEVGVAVGGLATGLYYYPAVTNNIRIIDFDGVWRLVITSGGGAVLGISYVVTGNLFVPIVGHWVYLLTLMTIRQLLTRGNDSF